MMSQSQCKTSSKLSARLESQSVSLILPSLKSGQKSLDLLEPATHALNRCKQFILYTAFVAFLSMTSEGEVEVRPGIYMTTYKKKDNVQSDILKDFLESNDVSWLRFELNKIGLSVLLMEDSNLQLAEIAHEDPLYKEVFTEACWSDSM